MKKVVLLIIVLIQMSILFAGNSASVRISATIPPRITVPEVTVAEASDVVVESNIENVTIVYDDPADRTYDDSLFTDCSTPYEEYLVSEATGIYPESSRNIMWVYVIAE